MQTLRQRKAGDACLRGLRFASCIYSTPTPTTTTIYVRQVPGAVNPMANPMGMMDMVKGQAYFGMTQMGMMQFAEAFFSGFVLVKIPFALTSSFKGMLQRGIELTYVGMRSFFFEEREAWSEHLRVVYVARSSFWSGADALGILHATQTRTHAPAHSRFPLVPTAHHDHERAQHAGRFVRERHLVDVLGGLWRQGPAALLHARGRR